MLTSAVTRLAETTSRWTYIVPLIVPDAEPCSLSFSPWLLVRRSWPVSFSEIVLAAKAGEDDVDAATPDAATPRTVIHVTAANDATAPLLKLKDNMTPPIGCLTHCLPNRVTSGAGQLQNYS